MQLKNLIIGVAVLGGLAAATVFVTRSPEPEPLDPREGNPLLTDEELRDLSRIVFLADGQSGVELRRTNTGHWELQGELPEPVEFSRLSRLARTLRDATVERMVTRNPDRMERLEFEGTGLELYGQNSETPFLALELGKSANTGGTYIRFGDDPETAYLVSERLRLQTDPENWRDRTPIDRDLADIAEVSLALSPENGETLTFSRPDAESDFQLQTETDAWETEVSRLERFLRSLLSLRSTRTVAMDSAEVTAAREVRQSVVLRTFDGQSLHLALGQKPEIPAIAPVDPDNPLGDNSDSGNNTTSEPEEPLEPAGPGIVWLDQLPPNHPFAALAESHAFVVADSLMDSFPTRDELLTEAPEPEETVQSEVDTESADSHDTASPPPNANE